MKRTEMLKIIEDCWADSTSFKSDRSISEFILKKIEKAGMLPPKSLDTTCLKKGLVRGYSMFFEWDDETEEKE